MTGEFAEVVIFALNPGTAPEAYLAASQRSRDWYRQQPRYLGSMLIDVFDNRWVGLLWWESAAAAEQAQARLAEEVDPSEFFQMIDLEMTMFFTGAIAARDGS